MKGPMGGTHSPKGAFHKCKKLLHPLPELEAGKLKLTGKVAHILARGGQLIHAASGERNTDKHGGRTDMRRETTKTVLAVFAVGLPRSPPEICLGPSLENCLWGSY